MLRVTACLAAGPSCLNGSAVAPVGGKEVYVFGSPYPYLEEASSDQMEVYVFNTVSLRWRTLPSVTLTQRGGELPPEAPPPSLTCHTAVLIDRVVYVFGGDTNSSAQCQCVSDALYTFDVDSHGWSRPEVSGSVPLGRVGHSACVYRKVMYVLGGYTYPYINTNDVLKLDTDTMVWCLVSTGGILPPCLMYSSVTLIGTKIFVFGGWGGTWAGPYSSTGVGDCSRGFVFDIHTNVWLRTPPAHPRPLEVAFPSAFARNGELYVLKSNDVWKYTPETSSWKKTEPKGRTLFWTDGMSLCTVGDRIVLCGGYDIPSIDRRGYDRPGFVGHYRPGILYVLDFNPSLKTLCKLAVIQYGLEQSDLPHDVRWELTNMTTNSS